MDIIVVLRTLLLLLNACIVPTNGQGCVSHDQIGESVVGKPSVLECAVQTNSTPLYITWFMPDNTRGNTNTMGARLEWPDGTAQCNVISNRDYSCGWIIDERKGVLTLDKTSLDFDDGSWQCELTSSNCNGTDTHFLSVKVLPLEESVHVEGLANGWVYRDLEYSINCTVETIKPEGSVYWRIGEDKLIQAPPNSKLNPDGKSFRMEGLLDTVISGRTAGVQVDCLVTEMNRPDDILLTKSYKSVEIWWKATTEVSTVTATDPIEGRPYSLQCDVTDGNPGEINSYQWKSDGIIVGGQTGPQLDIDELDRDEHSKTFTCAADNGAGMGDYGTALALQVWWKATTEVSKDKTADPIEGRPYSLQCDVTDGYPGEVNIYQWVKDGIIEGGQTRPQMDIQELDRDEHSKTFTCAADNGAGMGDHGTGLALSVWYPPNNTEGDYITRKTWLREKITLPCDVDANPAPTAYAWSKNGITKRGKENAFFYISYVTEADYGNYTCTVTNAVAAKSFVVQLVPFSVPDQPSQFESRLNTSQSIFLSWLPYNSGRITQTFELDCRISTDVDEYVTIMKGIPYPNASSGDRIPVSLVVDILDNQQLEPATSYDFRIRGEYNHPYRTGPYAFTSGSTKVRPVFELYLDSFMYVHENTRVAFAWVVDVGDPSTLEFQYRFMPTAGQEHTDWIVMLADIDPDAGSYNGITNVTLDPYNSYEFQLVAFEGSYETPPPADTTKPTIQPPPGVEKGMVGILIGTLFGGMVIGALVTVELKFMINNSADPRKKGGLNANYENESYMNIGVSTGLPAS